jgi:hypothetical protein
MTKAALHTAQQSSERRRTHASELALDHGSIDWEIALPETRQVDGSSSSSLRNPQIRKAPDGRASPYRLAPRYVVHTALAKVWDVFRAHAFSTSAMIDDILIFGCVWPLAAAT